MYLDSRINKRKKFTMKIWRLAKKNKEVDGSDNFN